MFCEQCEINWKQKFTVPAVSHTETESFILIVIVRLIINAFARTVVYGGTMPLVLASYTITTCMLLPCVYDAIAFEHTLHACVSTKRSIMTSYQYLGYT